MRSGEKEHTQNQRPNGGPCAVHSHRLHRPGGFSDPLKAFPSAASEDVGRQPHWCMTHEAERSPALSNQGVDTPTVVRPKMPCPSEVTQKPRETATEESHPRPRRSVWSRLWGVPRTRESRDQGQIRGRMSPGWKRGLTVNSTRDLSGHDENVRTRGTFTKITVSCT